VPKINPAAREFINFKFRGKTADNSPQTKMQDRTTRQFWLKPGGNCRVQSEKLDLADDMVLRQ
jgi:hypothetical protein